MPTVREPDGLALSSRNAYLSAEERQRAAALPNALNAAREAIRSGAPVGAALQQAKQSLVDAGFLRIDYLALVDAATLEPLDAARRRNAPDRRGRHRNDAAHRQYRVV